MKGTNAILISIFHLSNSGSCVAEALTSTSNKKYDCKFPQFRCNVKIQSGTVRDNDMKGGDVGDLIPPTKLTVCSRAKRQTRKTNQRQEDVGVWLDDALVCVLQKKTPIFRC